MTFLCSGPIGPADPPDAGDGVCCAGAAMFGPDRCTCWEPTYDLDQAVPVPAERGVREQMCADCAYRPGSPERQGEDHCAADEADLMELVAAGQPFTCHQGIRRPVSWRHPSGAEVPGSPSDYRPPIVGGIPHRADGSPADICAGWAALRLRALAGRLDPGNA